MAILYNDALNNPIPNALTQGNFRMSNSTKGDFVFGNVTLSNLILGNPWAILSNLDNIGLIKLTVSYFARGYSAFS